MTMLETLLTSIMATMKPIVMVLIIVIIINDMVTRKGFQTAFASSQPCSVDTMAEQMAPLALSIISLGGATLLQAEMEADAAVSELAQRLHALLVSGPEASNMGGKATTFESHTMSGGMPVCKVDLVYEGRLLDNTSSLGDSIAGDEATFTAITQRGLRMPACDLHGAHTDNPQYFTRLYQATDDERLELLDVCWFCVGTVFARVPAGKFRVLVEAAQTSGRAFDIRVEPSGDTWNAEHVLTENIEEHEVAQIELEEHQDELPIWLMNTTGSWKKGFQLRAISLIP